MTLAPPVVGAPRPLRPPKVAEAKLPNGLRVLAVRKPTVPRVEVRVATPLGGVRNLAAERVLAKTITSGTSDRSSVEIARAIQGLGATFAAGVGADHFHVSGSVLAPNLGALLELAAAIVTEPTFPNDEVTLERARVQQEIEISRSQAETLAAITLRRRLFGKHRYGSVLPDAAAVGRVGRKTVAGLHTQSIGPKGGVVVLVGDINPQAAIELVASTLGRWKTKVVTDTTKEAAITTSGPMILVDRPGSVQTNFKIAGPVPKIGTDDSYAVDIANTVFGGYFVSRWVDNLRERNGYTYSPYSAIVNMQHANYLDITADVGTDVTAASLVETSYELGRMCALEVTDEELESAKRYRAGIQALRAQSQAGLASMLAALVIHDLGVDYLRTYPQRIGALTKADIRAASAAYLAPAGLITVLVGDAERVEPAVRSLGDVRVQAPTT